MPTIKKIVFKFNKQVRKEFDRHPYSYMQVAKQIAEVLGAEKEVARV